MKSFLKFNVLLLILLAVLSSCQKETYCGVKNPLRDLPWLKEIRKHGYLYPEGMYRNIYQCTYFDSINGFFIEPCFNCFTYTAFLFNCDGIALFEYLGNPTYNYIEEWNIKDIELIWTNIK